MKTNKNMSSQINKEENTSEISSEELGKIHRKYHPQEHDLFDAIDDDYMKRFEKILEPKQSEYNRMPK